MYNELYYNAVNVFVRVWRVCASSVLQLYYPDPDSAMEAVRKGEVWGTLYFTENFTDALVARMALGKDSDDETLDQSEIRVWLDMSSKNLYFVRLYFFKSILR